MASNWAIVIGINQYRFLQPLKYAKRDAETMHDFLMQEAKFDRIFFFTDDSPSIGGKPTEPFRANLLRVLRQIFATPFMKDGDNFWFFFSGHGIPHNGQDYLMPLDGDPEDIENTGISTNTITNYLRSCGADNAVMILDACRSGGKKSGEGIGRQTEAEARQTGVISLFSCSPDQYSYELEAIGQGAFTCSLLEGLGNRGRCATVEQLNQYLKHRVPELISQHLPRVRQTPYTIAEPLERTHLILMPQHVNLTDITTLKNDAYRAERKQDWDLSQRLWIRVNTATLGQDTEAIEALQNLSIQRHTRATPPQPELRQTSDAPNASSQPIIQPQKGASEGATPTVPIIPTATVRPSLTSVPESQLSSPTNQQNQPPASVVLARRQFLKWAIPAGVGVLGVTVVSQFLGKSPQSSSSPTSGSSSKALPAKPKPSATAVDYSRLEGFLKAEKWKNADQETASLLLKAANREQEGWIGRNSVQTFPCEILIKIDRLWVKNSSGKFGFSVQKQIYIKNCGNPNDFSLKAIDCFYAQVGWIFKSGRDWTGDEYSLSMDSTSMVNYTASAPKGHLPWGWGWGIVGGKGWGGIYLDSDVIFSCNDL